MPGVWLRVVIAIALSLIVAGSRVKDVSAATFVVDRTDDTNAATAQVCSGAANDCSLRGAISKANATAGADTITFSASTNGVPFTLTLIGNDADNATGDLDINDSLTISGNGVNNTIIQGATNASFAGNIHDKVIGINQDGTHDSLTVSISGVTIRYGHNEVPFGDASFAYTGGGVDVFLTGGSNAITFSDVVISDNENVYSYGGGVNVDSCFSMASGCTVSGFAGTVTFTNVTISNNKASLWGGGVNLFSDDHNVVFNTSTLNANTTTGVGGGAQGGGINIRHTNGGTVALHGTAITNNTAKGPGGGVAISSANKASVTIDDTGGAASITGNTSQNNAGQEASGGGLLKGDGANTTTLTNVTISNNHADNQGTGGARHRAAAST